MLFSNLSFYHLVLIFSLLCFAKLISLQNKQKKIKIFGRRHFQSKNESAFQISQTRSNRLGNKRQVAVVKRLMTVRSWVQISTFLFIHRSFGSKAWMPKLSGN